MTRPHVIRADTIDLQNPDAPSAKDHSRQPARPGVLADGSPAPHQADALKHVEMEISEQHGRSPRASQDLSGKELQLLHDEAAETSYNAHDASENLLRNSALNAANISHESVDESDGEDELDDELTDKISSSPSIGDDEDIDFEFVYALHTFVATVEGQANATKGDTMVLLDDSNSYWWLVRVVKDSSIGYLPAEHIETPLERLARLNKHRNLDRSQTMLGDQDEDKRQNPLNPLKKAMRRRNTKKVEFSASNHYLEPADIEYSSSEDDEGDTTGEFGSQDQDHSALDESADTIAAGEPNAQNGHGATGTATAAAAAATAAAAAEMAAADENLRTGAEQTAATEGQTDRVGHARNAEGGVGVEQVRSSEERSSEELPQRQSRKGTVRNTDSFFRDETLETRKINLTPNLLRDDSNNASPRVSAGADPRLSLESLEKEEIASQTSSSKSAKEEKKKKEKRGMLGGMFKRSKDKKQKNASDRDTLVDDGETAAAGGLLAATATADSVPRKSPTPKESLESLQSSAERNSLGPQRQSSKLQKQPPSARLSRAASGAGNSGSGGLIQRQPSTERMVAAEAGRAPSSSMNGLARIDSSESRGYDDDTHSSFRPRDFADESDHRVNGGTVAAGVGVGAAAAAAASKGRPGPATRQAQEQQQQQQQQQYIQQPPPAQTFPPATTNVQSSQPAPTVDPRIDAHDTPAAPLRPAPTIASADTAASTTGSTTTTRHTGAAATTHQPPPLMEDTSSPEEDGDSSSSPHSPSSSPELAAHAAPTTAAGGAPTSAAAPTATTPLPRSAGVLTPTRQPLLNPHLDSSPATQQSSTGSTATTTNNTTTSRRSTTPTWSDASLRAYMDNDDSEIRDLLILVNDKSGVVPRKDHPFVTGLYRSESAKLLEIEKRLDGLLGDVLGLPKTNATASVKTSPLMNSKTSSAGAGAAAAAATATKSSVRAAR